MPIEIVRDDGEVIEFPDDTPDATIASVMRQLDQEQGARARGVDRGGRALQPAAPPAPPSSRRGQTRPIAREIEGALASFNRGIPFSADIQANARGAMAAGGDLVEQLTDGEREPIWASDITGAFQRGHDQQLQETRAASGDFMERRPNTANFAQGSGAVAPLILTQGRSAPASYAAPQLARGLPLWLQQTAQAGTVGALAGEIYGAGNPDLAGAPLEERLRAGNEGAGAGALLGLATPTAVNALRATWNNLGSPAVRAMENMGRRIPTPEPNSVGAMGRPMRPPAPPPRRQPPPLPREAAGTVDRLADRARMSPDQVEGALASARRNPQGQVLADVFDEPGRQTTRALAQWPGRTSQRARETARTRFAEASTTILRRLREGLGVSETRQQAIQRLAREYQQASAETYQPLFKEAMEAGDVARLESALSRLEASPTVKRAMARANELFADERAAGLVQGEVRDHIGRYTHYLRMALNDIIASGKRDGSLVGNTQRATIELRNRLTDALEDALPGYRGARQRWGGIADAEEALDEGAEFLNMLPNEVRARIAQMTEFERMHARIGLVDEITRGMRGGRVVGQQNVARALDFKDTQDVLAAAFDDPAQAAAFLDTLNTQNQLMVNAQTWGGGSSTAANVAHGADEALNTAGDMAGDVLTGKPGNAITRGVRGTINAATGGMIERANNVRGEALLRRVDTEDSAEFARQVVEELRRRAAARAAATQTSRVAAAGAGATAGNRKRQ